MTKQEFFALPTTKETVNKLQAMSNKGFIASDESFESKNWVFLGEAAGVLRSYLAQPRAMKKIMAVATTQKYYEDISRIKASGYRKELVLPF